MVREVIGEKPGRIHRVLCRAIPSGCMSSLTYNDSEIKNGTDFLKLNGWRLDRGAWLCGLPHKKDGLGQRMLAIDKDIPIEIGGRQNELLGRGMFYKLDDGSAELRIKLRKSSAELLEHFFEQWTPLALSFFARPNHPGVTREGWDDFLNNRT